MNLKVKNNGAIQLSQYSPITFLFAGYTISPGSYNFDC